MSEQGRIAETPSMIEFKAQEPSHSHGDRDLLGKLTPAQRAIVPYLLEGKTELQIAKLVYRSKHTVHDHARAIYERLGVRNKLELVILFSRVAK